MRRLRPIDSPPSESNGARGERSMAKRRKAFDCVKMKNRIQAQRWAEYESRKGEFESYLDFINARVEDSELMRIVREKLSGRKPPKG
jgi:hypothetical protein